MVFLSYFSWHYTKAPRNILGLLSNYLIGTWHRFLIGRHAKTLFAPWHRLQPSDVGEKPKDLAEAMVNPVIDLYVRILAAFIRLTIILIGLIAEIVILAVFIGLLIFWILWPIILVLFIAKGISIL